MANRETTLYRKLSQADQIKEFDDETGIVTALTNSMGIVDLDNDRLLPGAFENSMSRLEEDTVSVLWGHDSKEVVGKVLDGYEIGLQDGRSVLYLEMLFNLNSSRGRDAYSDVRGGFINEWSVGFNVDPSDISVTQEEGKSITNIEKVSLVEVSAVLRGASPGTGTVSVKAEKQKGAMPPHDTETTAWDTPWNGPAAVAALPADDEEAYARMFAYLSDGEDPSKKQSWKFPHHEFARAEDEGAANVRAATAGIAILNGGQGGADIPDSARAGIYRHLADHIRDADREPPELKEKSQIAGAPDKFTTPEEARKRAQSLGCDGAHQMEYQGQTVWMPCRNHDIYESVLTGEPSGPTYSADIDATKNHAEDYTVDAAIAASTKLLRVRLSWLISKLKNH